MPTVESYQKEGDKKKQAYEYFISKGYSPQASAGIVGNLVHESGLNATIEGDIGYKGGSSRGTAQWRGERLKRLKSKYGEEWTNFNNQLEFVDWELKNTHKNAGEKLTTANTVHEAGQIFSDFYEIPKKKYHENEQRRLAVQRVAADFLGEQEYSQQPNENINPQQTNFDNSEPFNNFGYGITSHSRVGTNLPEVEQVDKETPKKEENTSKEKEALLQKQQEDKFLQEYLSGNVEKELKERREEQLRAQQQVQQEQQPQFDAMQAYEEVSQFIDNPIMQQGGQIPTSRNGVFDSNGAPVIVPSGDITMKGVSYPILGISKETGERKIMLPNVENYFFENTKNVLEIPMMQQAGIFSEKDPSEYPGWAIPGSYNPNQQQIEGKATQEEGTEITKQDVENKLKEKNAAANQELETAFYNTMDKIDADLKVEQAVRNRELDIKEADYAAKVTNFAVKDTVIDNYYKDYSEENKEKVKQLQLELENKGYSPQGIDGKFGDKTKQAYTNMVEDSTVSATTIDRYYKKYNKENEPKVVGIQEKLVQRGYLSPDQVDGKFGENTKEAVRRFNLEVGGDQEAFDSKEVMKIKKLETEWCARGMANILDSQGVDSNAIGIKGVDAWHMNKKMNKKSGNTQVYNIYDKFKEEFSKVSTAEDLIKTTDEVKAKSQTTPDMYKKGDIVGLYWKGSEHHGDKAVLESETKNTHVGFVSAIENGVPIITHNVAGTVHHDPYNKLQTAWINRNEKLQKIPERKIADLGEVDSTQFIDNFEKQIERPLSQKESSVAKDLYSRATYNSKTLPKELDSNVDSEWLKKATLGIIRLESTLGINSNSSKEELGLLRKAAHNIRGTEEGDISYGAGKIKFNKLDSFAKNYFNVKSPEDLADPVKTSDLVSYSLIKNYDKFKNYAEQYPELNLDETDIRNMAILSHNQGSDLLLQTGRVEDERSPSEEVAELRKLYEGKVRDVTSTNYGWLSKAGAKGLANKFYDKEFPEGHETYIARVNKFGEGLISKPNK